MRSCVFSAGSLVLLLTVARAEAQSTSTDTPRGDRGLERTQPAKPAGAHFEQALNWYRAGKYRRAEQELEAALEVDPSGKDLVFNLALVQEKLGDLSGAIASLERFAEMEKDPKELERAAQTKQRLEGAQAELVAQKPVVHAPIALPRPCPPAVSRGKMDAWVIGTGTLAFASLLVGSVFGVRALALDRETEAPAARDSALIAELAFVTSLLSGAGSVSLYWGRVNDSPPEQATLPVALPRFSAARLMIRY